MRGAKLEHVEHRAEGLAALFRKAQRSVAIVTHPSTLLPEKYLCCG